MKDTDCSHYETADGDCLTNACSGCCVKYRAELDSLRLALETANARIDLDNAVCLCGCPASEHEDNGEDGEQCEHEDHECIRVAPAVLEIVGRVRLALETATRERDEWRRHAEEQLADVLRLRFLGIEFASQYGDRALACKYDNSCDDSGREPACIPCAFRHALGLMGVN